MVRCILLHDKIVVNKKGNRTCLAVNIYTDVALNRVFVPLMKAVVQ